MSFLQDIAMNTLWYSSTASEVPDNSDPSSSAIKHGAVAVNTNDGLMWVNVEGGDVGTDWELVASPSVPNPVTVALGGTGVQTLTAGSVLLGSGTNAITPLDVTAKGSLLVGDGSGDPRALSVGGTNGHVLTVANGQATGMQWAAPTGTTYTDGSGLTQSGTVFSLGTPSTLTSSTSNAITTSSHTHAVTGLGGAAQKVDYGVYCGSGSNSANGVSTGITTVKAVFIWEKSSSWDDVTSGNRDTLNMKFYIATETFGDYGGEGHMAIFHPYGDDFYGGRISFASGSFYVYHSGTYWTGSSNSVNVSGTDYYWLAIGD